MSPVVLEQQLRQLRLAATVAHVIPPVAIDLLASDGSVRRVGSMPEARPDLWACQFRALVSRMRSDPTVQTVAALLDVPPGSSIDIEVHLGCRSVRDLGGGVYVLHGQDRTRLVFATLLGGRRTRQVVSEVARPPSPGQDCPALQAMMAVGSPRVMHDRLTGVSVVFCDQEHPAGLPRLEAYGEAMFAACTIAELLDPLEG